MVDEMGINAALLLGKILHSDSKVKVGAKRGGKHLHDDSDSSSRRVKIRDLQSLLQSDGIDNHDPATSKLSEEYVGIGETQSSQVVDKNPVEHTDASHLERVPSKSLTHQVDHNGSKPLDLNSEICTDENSGYNDTRVPIEDGRKKSLNVTDQTGYGQAQKSLSVTHFDLNKEDVASSAIRDPFFRYRYHNNTKTRNILEFGRSTEHLEDREALRKWKEMKQNGFISPSYGGIPAAPKQRGRKSKHDVFKQKIEQAKKEQVDRFTKIAAPSGLLNGLNPGIINHVRNSKQVHSIIQALVRSEKRESCKQGCELKAGSKEPSDRSNEQENLNSSRMHGSSLSYEAASFNSIPERSLMGKFHLSHSSSTLLTSEDRLCKDLVIEEGRFNGKTYFVSHPKNNSEDDMLALKLSSSSTIVSESTSCVSNVESENVHSVDNLSVKAASVTSQWLQLLQQDINGRLAALRHSKKRVHAVITTELPFLLSKEFSSNQENDPYITKGSALVSSSNAIAELHRARWSKLFNQMDSALSEEEKELEHWLQQVNQIQEHCDQGLQHVQWHTMFGMQHFGATNNQFRSQLKDPEKDLSVRAAAASIYSTCNFVSSRENVSCC